MLIFSLTKYRQVAEDGMEIGNVQIGLKVYSEGERNVNSLETSRDLNFLTYVEL